MTFKTATSRMAALSTAALAVSLSLLSGVSPASAQANMNCAEYIKADAQMTASLSAADKAALQADPQAAAMDNKIRAYCKANPAATLSEATEKALQ